MSRAQLEAIAADLEAASGRATNLMNALSTNQLTQAPAAAGWSVAQCLDHLRLTSEALYPLIDRALQAAPRLQASPSVDYRMDIFGRLLTWLLEPPSIFKSATAAAFEPPSSTAADRVLEKFLGSQDEILKRVRGADRLAIDKVKIHSPFNKRVRYNLFSAFQILNAHQRRHLRQAERVKAQLSGRS